MEGNPTITNLKDFVDFYGSYKSDMEIARLLSISIRVVEITRKKNNNSCKNQNEKVLNLV